MKKVLVTGLNSYIGNSFEQWIKEQNEKHPEEEIQVTKCTLRGADWMKESWAGYDAILHVAGLAHVDVSSVSEESKQKYCKVNRDLAIDTAKKAKEDGVKQFINLSSIIVYGASAPIGKEKVITAETKPEPASFYGESKLQAEEGILPLADDHFIIANIRTPMVYGKNAKGNFPKLAELAKKTPIFPDVVNRRSMIYIKNLCELIRQIVLKEAGGMFYPQNEEQVSTSELVALIAECNGKKVKLVKGFEGCLAFAAKLNAKMDKVFGNLAYDQMISKVEGISYTPYSLTESIKDIYGKSEG